MQTALMRNEKTPTPTWVRSEEEEKVILLSLSFNPPDHSGDAQDIAWTVPNGFKRVTRRSRVVSAVNSANAWEIFPSDG